MGFFSKFFGVQMDKGADKLMEILVKWDPVGATEAEKRQIAATLSEFCIKCEDAKKKMMKEEADVTAVKDQASKKVALVKMWQSELVEPSTTPERKSKLETSLPALIKELQELGPVIDKEVREAELAKRVFETYDKVVLETNKKLQQKIAQAETIKSELEMAKAEEMLANEQVNAARVLAGIQSARDSFDAASNVIQKETEAAKTRTAAKLREAEMLTAPKNEDTFIAEELNKIEGGKVQLSIEEQLASIESKIK